MCGAAATAAFAGSILLPTLTGTAWGVGWFAVLLVVAGCLGAVLAVFPGGMVLGGVLRGVERRNGAPFHVGDDVVVLSRRCPGRIARVYDVWSERHQVRVELGLVEQAAVTDVFPYTDVCRLARGPGGRRAAGP